MSPYFFINQENQLIVNPELRSNVLSLGAEIEKLKINNEKDKVTELRSRLTVDTKKNIEKSINQSFGLSKQNREKFAKDLYLLIEEINSFEINSFYKEMLEGNITLLQDTVKLETDNAFFTQRFSKQIYLKNHPLISLLISEGCFEGNLSQIINENKNAINNQIIAHRNKDLFDILVKYPFFDHYSLISDYLLDSYADLNLDYINQYYIENKDLCKDMKLLSSYKLKYYNFSLNAVKFIHSIMPEDNIEDGKLSTSVIINNKKLLIAHSTKDLDVFKYLMDNDKNTISAYEKDRDSFICNLSAVKEFKIIIEKINYLKEQKKLDINKIEVLQFIDSGLDEDSVNKLVNLNINPKNNYKYMLNMLNGKCRNDLNALGVMEIFSEIKTLKEYNLFEFSNETAKAFYQSNMRGRIRQSKRINQIFTDINISTKKQETLNGEIPWWLIDNRDYIQELQENLSKEDFLCKNNKGLDYIDFILNKDGEIITYSQKALLGTMLNKYPDLFKSKPSDLLISKLALIVDNPIKLINNEKIENELSLFRFNSKEIAVMLLEKNNNGLNSLDYLWDLSQEISVYEKNKGDNSNLDSEKTMSRAKITKNKIIVRELLTIIKHNKSHIPIDYKINNGVTIAELIDLTVGVRIENLASEKDKKELEEFRNYFLKKEEVYGYQLATKKNENKNERVKLKI